MLTRGTLECILYGCKSSCCPPSQFPLLSLLHTFSLPLYRPCVIMPKISATRSSQHIHKKRNCALFPFHLLHAPVVLAELLNVDGCFSSVEVGRCGVRNSYHIFFPSLLSSIVSAPKDKTEAKKDNSMIGCWGFD